jgi:3'(2'), 5'-bisphosphate nucleotidase
VAPVIERLGITELVPCGSVGVKVARIATGAADAYFHGGRGAKKWDTCGPEAVLVAAGGRFTDLDGNPMDYGGTELAQERGLIASNGPLHHILVGAVAAVREQAISDRPPRV